LIKLEKSSVVVNHHRGADAFIESTRLRFCVAQGFLGALLLGDINGKTEDVRRAIDFDDVGGNEDDAAAMVMKAQPALDVPYRARTLQLGKKRVLFRRVFPPRKLGPSVTNDLRAFAADPAHEFVIDLHVIALREPRDVHEHGAGTECRAEARLAFAELK